MGKLSCGPSLCEQWERRSFAIEQIGTVLAVERTDYRGAGNKMNSC
jgi:hypothetical protein